MAACAGFLEKKSNMVLPFLDDMVKIWWKAKERSNQINTVSSSTAKRPSPVLDNDFGRQQAMVVSSIVDVSATQQLQMKPWQAMLLPSIKHQQP